MYDTNHDKANLTLLQRGEDSSLLATEIGLQPD